MAPWYLHNREEDLRPGAQGTTTSQLTERMPDSCARPGTERERRGDAAHRCHAMQRVRVLAGALVLAGLYARHITREFERLYCLVFA
jgi:hypothetical protein